MFEALEDRRLLAVTAHDANDSVLHDQVLDSMVFADDSEQGAISISLVSGVSHGSLSLASDGSYEFIAETGYVGPDSFVFEATNGTDTDTATASIDVFNTDPVAENAWESVSHDDVLESWAFGDAADLDALAYALAAAAAHGAVSLASDGSYTYTADAGYVGPDSFGFSVSDGIASSTGTVSIDVFNTTAPVADDAGETLLHDQVLQSFVTGHDDDLDALTFGLSGDGAHGAAVVNSDGSYTYTADAGYVGSDVFYFTVTDGAASDTGSVSIDIYNAAPTAYVASEDALHDDTLSSSVTADDLDGDALVFSVALQPANGVVIMNGDGTYTFTPETGYIGADSFIFSASDGAATDLATVSLNVYNPDVLHAQDDMVNGAETAVPLTIDPLDNDTGDAIFVESATSDYGTVTPQDLNGDGYDDAIDFQSWDNITEDAYVQYTIEDENGATDTATVFIAFQAGGNNSRPEFHVSRTDDTQTNTYSFTYFLGEEVAGTVFATDADNDHVFYTAPYRNQPYTVMPNGDVIRQLQFAQQAIGSQSTFDVTASDGRGGETVAKVTVTVASPVNAVDDQITLSRDEGATAVASAVSVLGNDVARFARANVIVMQAAEHGVVTMSNDGYFSYKNTDPTFAPTDTFTYKLQDLNTGLMSNVATVTITNELTSNPPVTFKAVDDHLGATVIDPMTLQYTSVTSVLTNDVYGANTTFQKLTDPRFGDVVLNPDGTIVYTPDNPNFHAITETFQYRLTSGGDTSIATVYIPFSEAPNNGPNVPLWSQEAPQFQKPYYVFEVPNGAQAIGVLTATDPNNDAITFSLTSKPPWVADAHTDPTILTLSVANGQQATPGTYTFSATVTDSQLSASGQRQEDVATVVVIISPAAAAQAPVFYENNVRDNDYTINLTLNDIQSASTRWIDTGQSVFADDPQMQAVSYEVPSSGASFTSPISVDAQTGRVVVDVSAIFEPGAATAVVIATDTDGNSAVGAIHVTVAGQAGYQLYVRGTGDSDPVAGNDVVQGGLGDCWFLSALAGLAQDNPQAIRAMIDDNGNGHFQVRFFQRNAQNQLTPVWIPVDFNPQGAAGAAIGTDITADGKAEFWPRVIETAYLQFVGGASNVTGGIPPTAWEMFTGVPGNPTFPPSILDEATLTNALNQHRLVWIGTNAGPILIGGLAPSHAYRVVSFDTVSKYVTLENPHGSYHATVKLSDLRSAIFGWWYQ